MKEVIIIVDTNSPKSSSYGYSKFHFECRKVLRIIQSEKNKIIGKLAFIRLYHLIENFISFQS